MDNNPPRKSSKTVKKLKIRKNFSMSEETYSKLQKLAEADESNASAMVTKWVLEKWKATHGDDKPPRPLRPDRRTINPKNQDGDRA